MVSSLPITESLAGIVLELDAPSVRVEQQFNTRSLVPEGTNLYTDELPPGTFTLGNAVNITTPGAWLFVLFGPQLFGPDVTESDLRLELSLTPGAPLRTLPVQGPFPGAAGTAFRTLFPPFAHRYRVTIGYQTTGGAPATGLNVRQVSLAWSPEKFTP